MSSKVVLALVLAISGLQFAASCTAPIRTPEDALFVRWLRMQIERDYPAWFAANDPTPVIETSYTRMVYSCLRCDNDGAVGDLTVSNFQMVNHSNYLSEEYCVTSNLEHEEGYVFQAGDSYLYKTDDSPLAFVGDYSVTGNVTKQSGASDHYSFQGQGRFRMELRTIVSPLILYNYTVTEDDYIDLEWPLSHHIAYLFVPVWSNTDKEDMFEGLTVNYDSPEERNAELGPNEFSPEQRIRKALAGTFSELMKSHLEIPVEHQPLKHIMVQYLKQIFPTRKFSDIISGRWTQP